MPTFTPPATGKTPRISADPVADGVPPAGQRLMRFFVSEAQAPSNVYFLDDGSIVTEFPPSTYSASGALLKTGFERIKTVWYGGHAPQTVTAAEGAALVAAGYTLT